MTHPHRSVRLAAIDLDGTLLDSRQNISDRNLRTLRLACDRGIQIAIVTGRRHSAARSLVALFNFPHFLITSAGALISSSEDGTLVANTWDSTLLQRFLAHVAMFRSQTFLIKHAEGKDQILCQVPDEGDPHVDRYLRLNGESILRCERLDNPVPENILQVAFMGGLEPMEMLRTRVEAFSGVEAISVSQTRYPERDFELIDVVESGADKGQSLKRLAQMLGIDASETMAIGDNLADRSMLEYAGRSVVMANGHDDLKRRWRVTGSNDADGVAEAVEECWLEIPS